MKNIERRPIRNITSGLATGAAWVWFILLLSSYPAVSLFPIILVFGISIYLSMLTWVLISAPETVSWPGAALSAVILFLLMSLACFSMYKPGGNDYILIAAILMLLCTVGTVFCGGVKTIKHLMSKGPKEDPERDGKSKFSGDKNTVLNFDRLTHPDAAIRDEALNDILLGGKCDERLLNALINHVSRKYENYREAQHSLKTFGAKSRMQYARALMHWLTDYEDDGSVNYVFAVSQLAGLGHEGLEHLVRVFRESTQVPVRDFALEKLVKMALRDDPEDRHGMLTQTRRCIDTALSDASARLRYQALLLLCEDRQHLIYSKKLTLSLLQAHLIRDTSQGIRAYCVHWLTGYHDESAMEIIVDTLEKGGPFYLEKQCVLYLRAVPCKDPAILKKIQTVLHEKVKNGYPDVKGEAAVYLGLPEGKTYLAKLEEKVEIGSAMLDGHGRKYDFLAYEDDDRHMWQAVKKNE